VTDRKKKIRKNRANSENKAKCDGSSLGHIYTSLLPGSKKYFTLQINHLPGVKGTDASAFIRIQHMCSS